jgi:hypothetical protein
MKQKVPWRWRFACAGVSLVLVSAPAVSEAQVSGRARVVEVVNSGTSTTILSDTGSLTDANDARETSQVAASIPSLLQGGTLHAVTIGWPDEAASEASIGNLVLTIGNNTIKADLVLSRVRAAQGEAAAGTVNLDGLSVNGVAVQLTGAANQTVPLVGGQLVINERRTSATGTTINALHVTVEGEPDVVIASVSAGIQ